VICGLDFFSKWNLVAKVNTYLASHCGTTITIVMRWHLC